MNFDKFVGSFEVSELRTQLSFVTSELEALEERFNNLWVCLEEAEAELTQYKEMVSILSGLEVENS